MEENKIQKTGLPLRKRINSFNGRFDIDLNHPYAVIERESNKHLDVWFNPDGKAAVEIDSKLYLIEDLKKLI